MYNNLRSGLLSAVKEVVGVRYYGNPKKKPRDRNCYTPFLLEEATKSILEAAAAPVPIYENVPVPLRTPESNPAKHTEEDVGKIYTMPTGDRKRLFSLGGLPKKYIEMTEMFNETSLMIRKPSVDIINYMNIADYSRPSIRYLLYGESGVGKSLCLAHILHYATVQNYFIIHVPYAPEWHKWKRTECNLSDSRPGLVDIPLHGALFLKNIQIQNAHLLEKLDLKTTEEYVWNQRESSPIGTPLTTIMGHGISRVKYSCDCVHYIIQELKRAATAGKCKVLIAVDGYNSFYSKRTMLKPEDKSKVEAERISLVDTMLSAVQPDWCNGAVVLTISTRSSLPDLRESYTPFYLLGRKGFETLDPFVPILVPRLTVDEFNNMLDYYEERRWLHRKEGRDEIDFITNRVPGEMMEYCRAL